jgi:hypothetical protein
MKRRAIQCQATRFLLGALLVGIGGSAVAHHGYAAYDRCRSFSIEGRLESLEWTNPHVVLNVRTDESVVYRVEWFSAQRLARAGIHQGFVNVGERVVISGSEHSDPAIDVITLLTEVRRIGSDSGWSRPFPVNATCGS